MKRLAGVLLALLFVVTSVPPAAAAGTAAPEHGAAALATAALPADRPDLRADWQDFGSCMSAAMPGLGVLSPGTVECAGAILDAGAGKVTDMAADAAMSAFQPFADGMVAFVGDLIVTGFTWWMATDSIRISDLGLFGGSRDDEAPLEAICLSIGVLIATLLTMFQGIRAIIRRKPGPLVHAAQGLMIHVLAVGLAVAVIDSLLLASDEMTDWILSISFESVEDAPVEIRDVLLPTVDNPIGLLAMSLFALLIGFIQLAILFLRQSALPILALLFPIASSGQVGEGATRQWMPKITVMILTIICYKPMAALIISAGFVEMSESAELLDWFRGLVTLLLSCLALGAMLSLFAPFGMAVGSATAAGGGLAPAAMNLVSALADRGDRSGDGGGQSGGTTTAVEHARTMEQVRDGGASDGGSAGGARASQAAVQQANSADKDAAAPGAVPGQRADGQPAAQSGSDQPRGDQQQSEGATTAVSPGAAGAGSGSGGVAAAASQVKVAVVAAEAARTTKNTVAGTMSNTNIDGGNGQS